jgi:Ca2+-binding EF-hand superfamily protein
VITSTVIDPQEFAQLVPIFGRQFPQLLEYAKKAEVMFEEGDINKDGKLTKEEFQEILKKVDRTVTSFPTTAQVAQQQGRYLAQAFNSTLREEDVKKIFHEIDQDKNGTLDKKELKKGLRRLGIPVSNVQLTLHSTNIITGRS